METTAAMQADAQQQFSLLLEQHRGIVLKVAHSYAWNPDDRAELAQEIAAQAWRAFGLPRTSGAAKPSKASS